MTDFVKQKGIIKESSFTVSKHESVGAANTIQQIQCSNTVMSVQELSNAKHTYSQNH